MEKIAAVVSLLVALSVAAERLVEIVKGLIPWLDLEQVDQKWEARRRCVLQVLAVVAGIVTVFLSRGAIPTGLVNLDDKSGVVALGLLASGGSGFWNSILTYVAKVKDVKEAEVAVRRQVALAEAGEKVNQQTVKKWIAVAEPGRIGYRRTRRLFLFGSLLNFTSTELIGTLSRFKFESSQPSKRPNSFS